MDERVAFAFDRGDGLSEHTTPRDAQLQAVGPPDRFAVILVILKDEEET